MLASCVWSNEVNLIGNTAKTSIEKLRYKHNNPHSDRETRVRFLTMREVRSRFQTPIKATTACRYSRIYLYSELQADFLEQKRTLYEYKIEISGA